MEYFFAAIALLLSIAMAFSFAPVFAKWIRWGEEEQRPLFRLFNVLLQPVLLIVYFMVMCILFNDSLIVLFGIDHHLYFNNILSLTGLR